MFAEAEVTAKGVRVSSQYAFGAAGSTMDRVTFSVPSPLTRSRSGAMIKMADGVLGLHWRLPPAAETVKPGAELVSV